MQFADNSLFTPVEEREIKPYSIGKMQRANPDGFAESYDCTESELCDIAFKQDIAWSLANGIPKHLSLDSPELGTWTCFKKSTTYFSARSKSVIQYLPVIEQPPQYNILKKYLEDLQQTATDLGIPYIYSHADEDIYSKLLHIIWNNKEMFTKVVPLIGGFHMLKIMIKLIGKRHELLSYKEWFVDAGGIIAPIADLAASSTGTMMQKTTVLKN